MAIIQISRIQHRSGLQENLPQLAGSELGWSIDQRKLYIGNGTLTDGAPVIGNTEILTEFSDVLELASSYTYKGDSVGYTAQTGATAAPITRSMSAKLDDFVSVKDFGAVGDGETDDTSAINRAFYQIFCREKNAEVRKSLYFPAGVYRTSDTVLIPPYAKVWGEGINSTIIRLDPDNSSVPDYVVRTTDSLQQTDANIGQNSAILPKNIEVSSMSFESLITTDICLIDAAEQCLFESVSFSGNTQKVDLSNAALNTGCIRVQGTPAAPPLMINFDKCVFKNAVYGVKVDENSSAITITMSRFDTLFRGVSLGEDLQPGDTGPTGFRITSNQFDSISDSGIVFDNVTNNISAFNLFLDVANTFNGAGNPTESVIQILENDNISIGDVFARSDSDDQIESRVLLSSNKRGIYFNNSKELAIGTYCRGSGIQLTLANNQSSVATIVSVPVTDFKSFNINYSITRDTYYRTGTFTAATTSGAGGIKFTDEYTENAVSGITLTASVSGTNVLFGYTSTNTVSGIINYSISHHLI